MSERTWGRGGRTAGLVNEAVRFVLELFLVVVAGWWGWYLGSSTRESVALLVLFPLAVCLLWGAIAAPRRRFGTARWVPSALFLVLTALAVGALVQMGFLTVALVFGTLAVVNEALLDAGLRTVSREAPRR